MINKFLDKDLQGIFQISYNGKFGLTPVGWALLQLGSVLDDKGSPHEKIANGLYAYQNPQVLPTSGKALPEAVNAYKAVKELLTTGSTSCQGQQDASSSGATLMGALHGCIPTLLTTLGKPMSESEAFFAKMPDAYTTVYKAMITLGGETLKVTRNEVKAKVIPKFYGAGNSQLVSLGEENIKFFLKALETTIPAIETHKKVFMGINFGMCEYIQFVDVLGREIKIPNLQPTHKYINTVLGNVPFTGKEFVPQEEAASLQAPVGVIHNLDSVLILRAREAAIKAGYRVSTLHDAIGIPFDKINHQRETYTNNLMELVEMNALGNYYKQFVGVDMPCTGSKDAVLAMLAKSPWVLS